MSSRSTGTPAAPSPEGDRPALKNTASAFTGAAPRRLDHLNLLAEDVANSGGSWKPAWAAG
jgi:hypothetical protein